MRRHRLAGLAVSRCVWVVAELRGARSPACAGTERSASGLCLPGRRPGGNRIHRTVGGQYLDDTSEIIFTGQGIQATVGKHKKPLTMGEANRAARQDRSRCAKSWRQTARTFDLRNRRGAYAEALKLLKEMGVTEEDLERLEEFAQRRDDEKRQLNPAIEETLALQLKIDAVRDARPTRDPAEDGRGRLESHQLLRRMCIPRSRSRNRTTPRRATPMTDTLPVVLNGQIMPGDVDRFRFDAEEGGQAGDGGRWPENWCRTWRMRSPAGSRRPWRSMTPNNREVAYADDYQFRPDPVLYYRVPQGRQLRVGDSRLDLSRARGFRLSHHAR